MGNILHANAKTTPRIKTEIQNATASIAVLAERYKLNPKTIIRWKNTLSVADKKSGPKVCNGLINLDTFQATFFNSAIFPAGVKYPMVE
ncbi:MAG: hypothetical protein H0A76_07245 [Candidatus Thiodubiliella endoseptemdiera]|uniref:Transposase n=1 Tax=Candidatus Thiodubiliella endoseptemdiera TaxID=2738886 RepID=A0A853F557_9GAMM|nr:hypothetical protein [Candidatus Thiodubiliella endoseptemdiera]